MSNGALRIFAPFWLLFSRKKTYRNKAVPRREMLDVAALPEGLKRDMGFLDGRPVRKDCDFSR